MPEIDPTPADLQDSVTRRIELCKKIARKAQYEHVLVDWRAVNRNYLIWQRWYYGYISLGYVLRNTGATIAPRHGKNHGKKGKRHDTASS